MQHSFDISIAQKYGVNVAIFLNNMVFWIQKNQANKRHFHDGRYWTYNSSRALAEIFPYWSTDQIDRLIKKCKEMGLLLTGNYNSTSYNRTNWYALTDSSLEMVGLPIPQKCGIDSTESRNQLGETAEPITDINTDIKTDVVGQQQDMNKNESKDCYPKEGKGKSKNCSIDPKELMVLYHEILPEASKIRCWTSARQRALNARCSEASYRECIEYWIDTFKIISTNEFLMGKKFNNERGPFKLTIDFILQQQSLAKIDEDFYTRG